MERDRLKESNLEALRCLNSNSQLVRCRGSVEYREPLSGTGKSFPRCDAHWGARLAEQERIDRLYAPNSDAPPRDFDSTLAGERWDEDY